MVLLSQKIQINLLTVNNLPDLLNIHDLNASPVAGSATGKSLNMMSNQALCMVKPTIPLVVNLPGSAWLVTAGC
ncbi:hypothetical protein IRO30_004091 [Salmonella enterica]|nr:hypothetical protein [Salmonella enterica]